MADELEWEQTIFTFILHAGNARSACKEAAEHARDGRWEEAEAALAAANAEQLQAHGINARIIQREAAGEALPFSVLLVHAMDLLLLAWSEIDFTEEFIALNRRVAALEADVAALRGRRD